MKCIQLTSSVNGAMNKYRRLSSFGRGIIMLYAWTLIGNVKFSTFS